MKIVFFIQILGLGGVLRQISILADGLARRGHAISVVALYPEDKHWNLLWNLDSIGVRSLLRQKPRGILPAGTQLVKATLELRKLLQDQHVQVLYAYQGHIGRFVGWLATRGIKQIKLVWGIQGSGHRSTLYTNDWKVSLPFRLCEWVSGGVPLMIANSEAGQAHRKNSGYRCIKQLVIHNGFDINQFKPDGESRMRTRSEWGLKDEKLIGIVARLFVSKGHRILLEAAAVLSKQRKDLRFVIVGDGSDKKQLELLSHKLGLTERIIWAGPRQDMPAVYNALDILCSSSIGGEGFPNVIGEAMACGVPCVVTDVGDSAKLVGNEGIVVPPDDSRMLADGLETMLGKLVNLNPFAIRARIVSHFSLASMVDATEKALMDLTT